MLSKRVLAFAPILNCLFTSHLVASFSATMLPTTPTLSSSSSSSNALGWRVVCISDTHSLMPSHDVPDGDILLHAGDFSRLGHLQELEQFHTYLDALPHKHKVFIPGNHDLSLHKAYYTSGGPSPRKFHRQLFQKPGFVPAEYSDQCLEVIKRPGTGPGELKYLVDEACEIRGLHGDDAEEQLLTIYGSPWQPEFYDWAYNLPIGPELAGKWQAIPAGIDILMTHGPPIEILDAAADGHLCGCPDLRKEVLNRVKPRLHVFGHIHEAYGTKIVNNTLFVNACTCNLSYRPNNKAIVVFLPFDKTLPARVLEE